MPKVGEVVKQYVSFQFKGRRVSFRPNTSDENILKEVLQTKCYSRKRVGFDVFSGERWLDLGANIGAFGVYCLTRGAVAVCYEPEPECFKLLKLNCPELECHDSAVSAYKDSHAELFLGKDRLNHSRGSVLFHGISRSVKVKNLYAEELMGEEYDGIKMDVEGAEMALLDYGLIPKCRKLVLEYHTSRDNDLKALKRRLDWLRGRFKNVLVRPEMLEMEKQGGEKKTFFDRPVFCWS